MNKRRMIRAAAGLLACAALVGMVGCLDNDNGDVQPEQVAFVSLYHASPDAPDLSIIVDDNQINTNPFDYSEYTGYLRFFTGDRELKFGPFGANNVTLDSTVTLEQGNAYSVFIVDEYDDASLLILNDNSDQAADGKAKVRFLNLSPDSEEIALRANDENDPLTPTQSFKEPADFVEVDAKAYNFQITSPDGSETILSVPDINLRPGWFYTIVVRGYLTPPGGNTNVISAEVVVN
jgi:hypothetical protein